MRSLSRSSQLTGHNPLSTLIPLWILPNGAWIIFPSIILAIFIRDIVKSLRYAAGEQARPNLKSVPARAHLKAQ